MKKALHFSMLFALLRAAIATFPDPRTGKNCHYSLESLGMTAFFTLFLQSPSFRSHEKYLKQLARNGNAARELHLDTIPCANHV